MKYKQLYLESQKRFNSRLLYMQSHYSDINRVVNNLYDYLSDKLLHEISLELYKELTKELDKISKICRDNTVNYDGDIDNFKEHETD